MKSKLLPEAPEVAWLFQQEDKQREGQKKETHSIFALRIQNSLYLGKSLAPSLCYFLLLVHGSWEIRVAG